MHMSSMYNIIENPDHNNLCLFFKLYKSLYGGLDGSFTTEKVNNFIKIIDDSCSVLQKVTDDIFSDFKIKLFSKTSSDKCKKLRSKTNIIYLLLSSIIGFIKRGDDVENIINSINKVLIYHYMVDDSEGEKEDEKDYFKNKNNIVFAAAGSFIDNKSNDFLKNPDNICKNLDKSLFIAIIKNIFKYCNNPIDCGDKKKNRRQLKFSEKIMMTYYFKALCSQNQLNNKFSIEHIIPFSEWKDILILKEVGI